MRFLFLHIIIIFAFTQINAQEIQKFANYTIEFPLNYSPYLSKIKSKNNLEGKKTFAPLEILDKDSLEIKARKIFLHSLERIGKREVISQRLKEEFDLSKLDSHIELTYTGNGDILYIEFYLPQSVIYDFISEEDINFIYNNLKTGLKLKIEGHGGHIYLNHYDLDWRTNYQKTRIYLTDFHRKESLAKGFKYYTIKRWDQDYWEISTAEKSFFTRKTRFTYDGIYPHYIDSVVSREIEKVLENQNKYTQFYQAAESEFINNKKVLLHTEIVYNGMGEIVYCYFIAHSVVLDSLLTEYDFLAISNALKKVTLHGEKDSLNGYTPWGVYDPNWKIGRTSASVSFIRF